MKVILKEIFGEKSFFRSLYREAKEAVLEWRYGKRGLPQSVNGEEFLVLPRHRLTLAGQYDLPVSTFLRERVVPGSFCVNVGANIGLYALQFARWTGPSGKVVVFEPSPASAADLKTHLAMNGLSSLVRVEEKAVSSEKGRAEFFVHGTAQMNRLGAPNPLLSSAESISVEVVSLDMFSREEGRDPDWILIDIEGFEIKALQGAKEWIRRRGPNLGLVVEMHPNAWEIAGTGRQDLEELLEELHLESVPLNGQRDCLAEYGMVQLKPARSFALQLTE